MKKMKKLIAIFVVIATIASLCAFSIPVAAEEADSVTTIQVTEEEYLLIEKLEALGMITNEYDPAIYVTRAQMAEIISYYMKLSVVDGNSTTSPFYDVSPRNESYGAIKALYDLGIITGDGNLNFKPDDYVTYDEALVFVINAIGHKIFAVREGGYPTGYHRVAIKHDMLKNLSMQKGSDPVKLTDVYRMLESALTAAAVEITYYGDGDVHYTLSDTETFLSENYGMVKYRGVVTGNQYTRLTNAKSSLTDEQIEIEGVIYDTPGYVYGYFLGYTVDYYVKENSATDYELAYVEETKKANEVIKVDAEDILSAKTTNNRIYYTDKENEDKEHHITFIDSLDVIYNNQSWTGYGSLSVVIPARGYIEALDNNRDGIYDVLFISEYENVIVSGVDSYNETIYDKITGATISLDATDHKVAYYYADDLSKKADFSDLAQNQVLSIMASKATEKVITVYINQKAVTGKITGHSSDLGYEIDGTYYEAAYNYYSTEPLAVGLAGVFYLDINDEIATYRYDTTQEATQYAAMVAIDYRIGTFETRISVRIFTQDGEMLEAPLAERVSIDNVKYDLTNSTEAVSVLGIITNGYRDDGIYKVNSSYIVKYGIGSSGEITTLDMGGIGGEGRLNILADGFEYMLYRFNGMFYAKEPGTGRKVFSRFDRTNGIIFGTPPTGNLDDTDKFVIIPNGEFKDNKSYKAPTHATGMITVESISMYSSNSSDVPMTDVLLFEGWNSTGAGDITTEDTSIDIVTSITDAVDEDGMVVNKIYFEDGSSVLCNTEVNYWKGTQNPDPVKKTIASLITATPPAVAELRPGVVIQYSVDSDGLVDTIKFISEYDSALHTVTPTFYTSGSNPNEEVDLGTSSTEYSLAVGEVVLNDTTTQMLTVKIGADDYVIYTGAAKSCILYNSDRETAKAIGIEELLPGDKFTVRIIGYYAMEEMIVFR